VNAASTGSVTITAKDAATGMTDTVSVVVTPAVLTGIVVTPANRNLPAGFTAAYTATGNYSDGSSQNITAQVSWTSLNTSLAIVGDAPATKGIVTGLAAGTSTIIAKSGAISGQTPVKVTAETLTSITVTPATAALFLGQTQQYEADGTFSGGTTLRITGQVIWASSNTAAATISNAAGSKGLATAGLFPLSATTISATRNAVVGTATLTRAVP
jgi:hypothetical protein